MPVQGLARILQVERFESVLHTLARLLVQSYVADAESHGHDLAAIGIGFITRRHTYHGLLNLGQHVHALVCLASQAECDVTLRPEHVECAWVTGPHVKELSFFHSLDVFQICLLFKHTEASVTLFLCVSHHFRKVRCIHVFHVSNLGQVEMRITEPSSCLRAHKKFHV